MQCGPTPERFVPTALTRFRVSGSARPLSCQGSLWTPWGIKGQATGDFGLPPSRRLLDEMQRSFSDAPKYWDAFSRRLERSRESRTTLTREAWMAGLFELVGFLPLEYQRAAARLKPTSGQSQERRTPNHLHRRGRGLEHASNSPNTYFLGLVSGAARYPERVPHHRDPLRHGQKGIIKSPFWPEPRWVLIRWPDRTGIRRQGQPCGLSRTQSPIRWSTGWAKSTGTSAVCASGEDLPAADDCPFAVGIPGTHGIV